MLLIEKVVKLLDDFHYDLFYEHVRTLSKRSYYPLVLVEAIDRDTLTEKPTERLFFEVYGDEPEDQKDLQKLFSLGHYTFRLTSFLSRNYPDYLYSNVSRIQHWINTGRLAEAKQLADILLEVAQKIEDYTTQATVLGILAQHEIRQNDMAAGVRLYQQLAKVIEAQRELEELNLLRFEQALIKSKQISAAELEARLERLTPYRKSERTGIRLVADMEYLYLLHTNQDARFFAPEMLDALNGVREELDKYEYIVLPFLITLRSILDYLFLRYSMRQLGDESVMEQAEQLTENAAGELFWNSYVNLPELSSIGVQTSYLVSNFFYSYRPDASELIGEETREKIDLLKERCQRLLDNPLLRELYIIPYINGTTIYAGLLLLGDQKDLQNCIETLEYMLLHYQQVAFHSYLDPVFVTLVMAHFALEDYAGLEKSYRRYKKSTKGKNVNFENDLTIHAYYYIAKYRETQRAGYAKKLDRLLVQAKQEASLAAVLATLGEVCEYFSVPVQFEYS